MKKMTLPLALVPFLAPSAFAQSDYKDLSPGDRIEIRLRNDSTIMGTLAAPATNPKAAAIDYERAASLTLDLGLEYPGVNGTTTVAKFEIRAVRPLQPLSRDQIRTKEELKRRIAEDLARASKARPASEPEVAPAPPPKSAEPLAKDDELKKAAEAYKKFPPPDWSVERHNAIRLKTARGQALTAAEAEFDQNFALWEKGRAGAARANEPQKP